jgi:hypothetical protein
MDQFQDHGAARSIVQERIALSQHIFIVFRKRSHYGEGAGYGCILPY